MTIHSKLSTASNSCAATVDFATAQAILRLAALPLGSETVALEKAGHRILAEPVLAKINSPRFDVAAMDGYAVRSTDIAAGHNRFKVVGESYPGSARITLAGPKKAMRIMTGAPMPIGADRIVVLEQCTVEGDFVTIRETLHNKPHVRPRGSDFVCGDTLLEQGATINPNALVLAAASDANKLVVHRRPRLSCLASGDELVDSGDASSTGTAIPDSLSQAVLLLGRQWGAKSGKASRVKDTPEAIEGAARDLLPDCDVLAVIGGASRGDRDFARAGLVPLGLSINFAGIAMKPGKPVWYGRIGDRHILGLPGNPVAAITIARLFLAPLLTGLGGRGTEAGLRTHYLPLADAVQCAPREQFLCGYEDEGHIRLIKRQSASRQLSLQAADILVQIPAGSRDYPAGTQMATYRF